MSNNKDVSEDQIYTIPLTHAWIAPIKKRTPRSIRVLKELIKKNMKAERVIISSEINEELWARGIEGAPRQIRLRVVKDKDNVVRVQLAKGEQKVV